MFCHNCGKQIPDDTSFCRYCGAPQKEAQPAPPQQAAYQPPTQVPAPPAPVQPQQAAYQPAPQAPQQAAYQPQPSARQSPAQPQERVAAGILGALLGALPGVLLMYILFKMDFVASLTGIAMLLCAVWGYKHFGRELSKKGVFFSILVVIVMIYLGNRLCWAGELRDMMAPSSSIPWYFFHLNDMLKIRGHHSIRDAYYECLMKQYAFAALGAVFLTVNLFRGSRAAKKK